MVGTKWERWNKAMRDYLIKTQATGGLEAGSWFFPRPAWGCGRASL